MPTCRPQVAQLRKCLQPALKRIKHVTAPFLPQLSAAPARIIHLFAQMQVGIELLVELRDKLVLRSGQHHFFITVKT